jgi:hypothetical protein
MKARFRCDNCGRHVPLKHDTCPHCGKRFTAVLCPVCGFEGESLLFRGGCPSCGYQGARSGAPAAAQLRPRKPQKPLLPSWFYLWSSVALLVVLAVFVFLLLRPQ